MPRIDKSKTMLPYLGMLRENNITVSPSDLAALCSLLDDAAYDGDRTEHIAMNVSGGVVWGQMRKGVKYLSVAESDATAPVCEDGDVWDRTELYSREGIIGEKTLPASDPTMWRDGVFGWVLGDKHCRIVRICAEDGFLRGGWGSDGAFIPFVSVRKGRRGDKWGMIPDHYLLGAAALWRETQDHNFWGLPKAIIRRQCEIRGWCRMATSGKIMTKPGAYRSCVDENSPEAYAAYQTGLLSPRIWPVGVIEALARQIGPDKQGEGCAAFYDAMSEWCAMEATAGYMTTTEDMLRYVAEKKKMGWLP